MGASPSAFSQCLNLNLNLNWGTTLRFLCGRNDENGCCFDWMGTAGWGFLSASFRVAEDGGFLGVHCKWE